MELKNNPHNRQKKKITSLTLSKDDLKTLCLKLQEKANSAAKIEIENYVRGEIEEEQYKKDLETINELFQLSITITGKNGEEITGVVNELFDLASYPKEVKYVFIDTKIKFKVRNYNPLNGFRIFLDFTKPKIFDLNFLPSANTPNESNFEVEGYDTTWVTGVFADIGNFLNERKSNFSFFHKHSIYDLLLYLLGFPISFWICYKLSDKLDTLFQNNFMVNASYMYVFLSSLVIFRLLFHYIRWVTPLVEYVYDGSKIGTHRTIAFGISISIVSAVIYDIFKSFI